MDSFKEPCRHHSVPVEMDESMTPTSLDQFWSSWCNKCNEQKETSKRPQDQDCDPHDVSEVTPTDSQYQHKPGAVYQTKPEFHFIPPAHSGQMIPPHPADDSVRDQAQLYEWDRAGNKRTGFAGALSRSRDPSVEEAECLEPPLPLMSDAIAFHPGQYPAAGPNPKQDCLRQCAYCPPANPPHHNYNHFHYKYDPQQGSQYHQQSWNPPQNRPQLRDASSLPQSAAPHRDVIREVSIDRSFQAAPGPATREIRKTISLPEECRNVFITYSVDTAKEILLFTKFLADQGFKPAIDMFDNPLRRMSIVKWMDTFLNDKSVLIIVVISPKYKEDVEGDGDDEHGLHTKYIHNQIQNEYIQQGCLNFRLVPVLFPNATKRHVPNWLQSTRIYHWPRDTQDLLLRLLREERYIIPQRGGDLTLTVRPL
ncbi:adapter protein CIKS [Anabas testudineus]|uniref:E3 ubiquitin ligase TRAF3IP2 n=1 Tax=Anabas testudineus TaxID=64144 RepID=A0A3Q1IFP2_ANATE|nr:adapter protein CIKS [Anabas testudineus]XP_026196728.1 adapter protein CIKS [Anabas testudineus]XP_026196729.1 adapter protein CIKS [Anabas testudineus]